MSKQSEAKKQQNYNPKPVHNTCSNCAHYRSVYREMRDWRGNIYVEEKELRCGIGGFAVNKLATCSAHELK